MSDSGRQAEREQVTTRGGRPIRSGPGRVLIAVYLLFSIAATARAGYQIATKFDEAPVAYLLSALAAVIYIVASYGLSRSGRTGWRIALASCTVELMYFAESGNAL